VKQSKHNQSDGGEIMKEKRIRERRISFNSGQLFPFQDYLEKIVQGDRRTTPDRRLNNIWLELVTLKPGDIQQSRSHKVHRSIK
jgi:hypothetical protein